MELNTYNFEKKFVDLPKEIPLFPLNNILLLPRSRLPLNLFENRYLHMFDHALKADRMIGMIQPRESAKNSSKKPDLYDVGCAGLIVAFSQTNDNRYEIVLKGVSRFKVIKEKELFNGFRRAKIKFDSFKKDLAAESLSSSNDRANFEKKVKTYLEKQNVNADWQAIEASSDEDLVNSISMGCPFSNIEKQALMEAKNISERFKVLSSLLDMSINDSESYQSSSIS